MKNKYLVLLITLSLTLCACGKEGLVLSEDSDPNPNDQYENDRYASEKETSSFDTQKNEKEVCGVVHICGAVNDPGIYEFYEDQRLYELIEKAGGFDEEADTDAVNLAMGIEDAQQIRIPYIGEELVLSDDKLIDLNKANADELCTIPGIGESRAKAIIEYREQNGGFKNTEELMNVSGIKEATFNKIKPYVCIN